MRFTNALCKGFILPALLVSLAAAQGGWTVQASGTTRNLNAVRFHDDMNGWTVGDSGTILKTTNGGASWQLRSAGTTRHIKALHFISGTTGWAAGDSGLLLRTTDGGETWQARASGVTTGLRVVRFLDLDSGWVGGDSGILLRTLNGGATWTPVAVGAFTGVQARINALAFGSSGVGYAATGSGYQGGLLRTNNGGITWTVATAGYEWADLAYFGDSLFALHGRLFTIGPGTPIWEIQVTTDDGSSWHLLNGDAVNTPRSIHFIHSRMGWAAGANGYILRWTDSSGWVTQRSGGGIHFNSVYFVNAQTGWAVGGGGVILKSQNGGVAVLGPRNLPSAASPLNGHRFSYRLTANAPVHISLSRLDGTLATVLMDGMMPAGTHSLSLTGRVPAGLYLLEYRTGTETRRFRALIH